MVPEAGHVASVVSELFESFTRKQKLVLLASVLNPFGDFFVLVRRRLKMGRWTAASMQILKGALRSGGIRAPGWVLLRDFERGVTICSSLGIHLVSRQGTGWA